MISENITRVLIHGLNISIHNKFGISISWNNLIDQNAIKVLIK